MYKIVKKLLSLLLILLAADAPLSAGGLKDSYMGPNR